MSLTQCGMRCDVCSNFIIGLVPDENGNFYYQFSVKGIEQKLDCHPACKKKVQESFANKDWKSLPEGPLRKAFAEAMKG